MSRIHAHFGQLIKMQPTRPGALKMKKIYDVTSEASITSPVRSNHVV